MKESIQRKDQDVAYSFRESEILRHSQKALNELGVDSEQCVYRGKQFRYRSLNQGYLEMDDQGLVMTGRGSFMETIPLIEELCPYCKKHLRTYFGRDRFDNKSFHKSAKDGDATMEIFRERLSCQKCGWWGIRLGERQSSVDYASVVTYHVSGMMKRFSVSDPDSCLDDLVFWIKRNNQAITEIDPFKFESLIRDCLRNRYPESEVTLIGGRKDRGVDIYIARNNENPILVQVKRRSNIDRSESVNTVRALNGVLVREGIPHGAVITTARQFSNEAVQETEIKAKPGSDFDRYSMNLIAYDEVIEMIKSLKNDTTPFAGHMQAPSLEAWVESYYEPR